MVYNDGEKGVQQWAMFITAHEEYAVQKVNIGNWALILLLRQMLDFMKEHNAKLLMSAYGHIGGYKVELKEPPYDAILKNDKLNSDWILLLGMFDQYSTVALESQMAISMGANLNPQDERVIDAEWVTEKLEAHDFAVRSAMSDLYIQSVLG